MARNQVTIGTFLSERKVRLKPLVANEMNLPRIDKIDFSGKIHLSEGKITKTDMILVKKGDLVISGINVEKGALAVYEGASDVLATIHYSSYLYDDTQIDIAYFKWFLKSSVFKEILLEQTKGGIKTEIKPKHFLALNIMLPDLEEQKRIVKNLQSVHTELTELWDLGSSNKHYVKHLKQAILQEAIQGKIVPQHPKDEPARELLKRIQAEKQVLIKAGKLKAQKPLPPVDEADVPFQLPPNWQWVRFGNTTFNLDFVRVPLSLTERDQMKKTYDYYGASGVIDKVENYLFDKPLLLIGEDGANLINRSTPIAFIAKGNYWVNNHAHVLDSYNFDVLSYLEVFINATDLKPYVTGIAQPKMNQQKMNSISIALPPLDEQKRIVAKVDELMALCDALEAQLNEQQSHATALLDSLVHELIGAEASA